jgi:hypothetical protein
MSRRLVAPASRLDSRAKSGKRRATAACGNGRRPGGGGEADGLHGVRTGWHRGERALSAAGWLPSLATCWRPAGAGVCNVSSSSCTADAGQRRAIKEPTDRPARPHCRTRRSPIQNRKTAEKSSLSSTETRLPREHRSSSTMIPAKVTYRRRSAAFLFRLKPSTRSDSRRRRRRRRQHQQPTD